jgi:hypothetical protein
VVRSLSLVYRLLGLGLLVFAGVSCSESSSASSDGGGVVFNPCAPLALVADPGATADQAQGVAAGLALWNNAAGTQLSMLNALASASAGDAGSTAGPSLPIHFQTAGAPFRGLYDPIDVEIFINNDLSGSPLPIVIAHEIGHSFGLVHIPDGERPSLMNPDNMTVTPTPTDVATLAAVWGRCGSLDAEETQ